MDKKFFELFERDQWIWQTFSGKAYKEQNTKNGRDIVARSYTTQDIAEFEQKIPALQAQGADIFFQVNIGPTRKGADVTEVAALFLDLDGAPINPVIDDAKAGVIPRPNAIVNTRPGRYHVYWLVEDCATAQFRQAQKLLANRYGGDPAIHDLSRVMRAPGTMNNKTTTPHPVTAKILHPNYCSMHDLIDINYGVQRTPGAVASQLMEGEWENLSENAYAVDQITAGNRTEAIMSEAGRYIAITPGANYAEVMTHLKAWETEKLRPGDPPKTQESWDSEISPGVQKFLENARAERERAEREHKERVAVVAEGGGNASAWERAIDDKQYTYDEWVGRFVYVSSEDRVFDLQKQANAESWKLSSFKTWANPYKVPGGKTSLATKWLNDSSRRMTVHISTYQPTPWSPKNKCHQSRIVDDELTKVLAYNTYQQPMIDPADVLDTDKVSLAIEHIKFLCNYDERLYTYMLNWLAFTVQQPQERIPTVPLIISKPGVGKGWLCECMTELLGDKNVNSLDMSKFAANNQFNGFMVNCKMVVVHETKASRRVVEALKSLVTEKALDINIKYGANKKQHIYANMLMFSNHDDAMPLDEGDRRYVVIRHMGDAKSPAYYTELFNWLKGDGINHLFRYLLDRDLSSFDFAAPAIMTKAKIAMIQTARSEDEQIVMDAIDERDGVFALDVIPASMITSYVEKVRGTVLEKGDRIALFKRVNEQIRHVGRAGRNHDRQNMYAVRNLEKYGDIQPNALREFYDQAIAIDTESRKLKQVR